MNSPLRIAYIDHTGDMGGAEHLLLSLLRQLPSEEIAPFLFCGQDGPFTKEAIRLGIPTQIVKLPKFYSTSWVLGTRKVFNPFAVLWNGMFLTFAAWRLKKVMCASEIDIIQTNTILSHIYGGMAARLLQIPCIWYFHDLVEPRRLAGLITLIWRFLTAVLPDRIVADSHAVLEHLSSSSHGKVIYPGVMDADGKNHERITPLHKRLALPPDSVLIGALGRIAYVKGLDILVEAAQNVIPEHQNVHLVIFGGALFGDDAYKSKLERQVNQSGLATNWHWMGYDEYAKEYLKEFNFVIFPSRREAFGLTAIEAGLSSKAVIASSVGGIPEIIEHEETGILVPPEDPKKLALAIKKLLENQELTTVMGRNARLRVKRLFNNARFLNEFLTFYRTFRVNEQVRVE